MYVLGLSVCLIAVNSVHAHIPGTTHSPLSILVGSICSCSLGDFLPVNYVASY